MIEQKFKQPGLLSETEATSLFPKMADLILVFFPSPGVFVRDTFTIPASFKPEVAMYYESDGEPFSDMYVFLPAVLQSQYDAGKTHTGIVYDKEILKFDSDLIHSLKNQCQGPIEHRLG